MVKILKKILEKNKNVLLMVVGNGPVLKEMKDTAKKEKIDENVIFFGMQNNVKPFYKVADVSVICSLVEGLTITTYEALAMGIPVVTADVGGQKELINEEVGVIVPCLQKEEDIFDCNYQEEEIMPYVDGIQKVIKKLKEYKKNARQRILNGFTIDNMIENMDGVFEEIKNNPNIEKIENAKNMKNNIDLTKEFITRYFIGAQIEYSWLVQNFNRENVDIDWKLEKKENKAIYYENTLEYKIKHPFYVILTKLHLYELLKRILKRGE